VVLTLSGRRDGRESPASTTWRVAVYYVRRGSVPPQRHTQHRGPDGTLYAEELFGVEGFVGRNSLLYHLVPPTRRTRSRPP
jgi:hypothetical protein